MFFPSAFVVPKAFLAFSDELELQSGISNAVLIATKEGFMKLNTKAFTLTCGLLWGFGMFFMTWWVIAFDGVDTGPTFIAKLYRGYTITPSGSFIGLAWGLLDGSLGGFFLSWLYNRFILHRSGEAAEINEEEDIESREAPRVLLD